MTSKILLRHDLCLEAFWRNEAGSWSFLVCQPMVNRILGNLDVGTEVIRDFVEWRKFVCNLNSKEQVCYLIHSYLFKWKKERGLSLCLSALFFFNKNMDFLFAPVCATEDSKTFSALDLKRYCEQIYSFCKNASLLCSVTFIFVSLFIISLLFVSLIGNFN